MSQIPSSGSPKDVPTTASAPASRRTSPSSSSSEVKTSSVAKSSLTEGSGSSQTVTSLDSKQIKSGSDMANKKTDSGLAKVANAWAPSSTAPKTAGPPDSSLSEEAFEMVEPAKIETYLDPSYQAKYPGIVKEREKKRLERIRLAGELAKLSPEERAKAAKAIHWTEHLKASPQSLPELQEQDLHRLAQEGTLFKELGRRSGMMKTAARSLKDRLANVGNSAGLDGLSQIIMDVPRRERVRWLARMNLDIGTLLNSQARLYFELSAWEAHQDASPQLYKDMQLTLAQQLQQPEALEALHNMDWLTALSAVPMSDRSPQEIRVLEDMLVEGLKDVITLNNSVAETLVTARLGDAGAGV
ncbi:MAG: hypothetical protein ACOYKZ_07750 [Chlamydiia bacterium]